MGDENPIRTLGDYCKPSHEGYKNTIELLVGNNVDFLVVDSLDLDGENREQTCLRLFQFSLRDQANNWLERFPTGSISTWEDLTTRFLAQLFLPGRTVKLRNDILIRTIDQSAGGKLRDLNSEESWALLKDLALYDNESWNDLWDFAKPVKAIALPQDVPNARLSKFEADFKRKQGEMTNKIDIVLKAITDQIMSTLPSDTVKNLKLGTHPVSSARSYPTMDPQCSTQIHSSINAITIHPKQPKEPQVNEPNVKKRSPEDTNTMIHNDEKWDTSQLELKGSTNLGPNKNDDEIEWLDVEEPLDLVDTMKNDYDRGCRRTSDLEDKFYRDIIKLRPEYLTGMDDEGELT
ncbi:MAK10-like protein [Tanacetum coccineum]